MDICSVSVPGNRIIRDFRTIKTLLLQPPWLISQPVRLNRHAKGMDRPCTVHRTGGLPSAPSCDQYGSLSMEHFAWYNYYPGDRMLGNTGAKPRLHFVLPCGTAFTNLRLCICLATWNWLRVFHPFTRRQTASRSLTGRNRGRVCAR